MDYNRDVYRACLLAAALSLSAKETGCEERERPVVVVPDHLRAAPRGPHERTALPGRTDPPLDAEGREQVRRVIRAKISDLKACYEGGACPSVVLRFKIHHGGSTEVLEVADLQTPAADACIRRVLGSMRFPQLRGGGQATVVTYPFRPRCSGD